MRDTEPNWPYPSEPKAPSGSPRTQIGPYQLIAKIGEGGMGTVWLTKLPGPAGFNKLAVVKELRVDLADSSAFVDMFLNEARLAARLTHPNVIHTYGANEDNGRLYIAMEYLDGQPWSQVRHVLWTNRSLPLALHLKVLVDALTGLHYAHELRDYDGTPLQVVHRDMSPQNVFVTYDGLVKVVDFGVARALPSPRLSPRPAAGSLFPPGSPPAPRQSEAPMFVGKVAYSPPEQIRGEAIDRRADIFAVGVMLWEALAGRRLMETEAGQDRLAAVKKRANEPAPRIRDVVSSMPRLLSDICDRALALDPNDRFSTALEFRDAINGYLGEIAPDLDSAQLGQLVGAAFRDERTRINGLIERSLMRSLPASPPPVESLIDTQRPPPELGDHTIRADLSELASVSKLPDEALLAEATSSVMSTRTPLDPETAKKKDRKRAIQIAGGVLAVLLLWVIYRLALHAPADEVTARPLPEAPPALTVPPATAPQSNHAPTAAARIKLTITAVPENASIFLDGAQLHNPFSGQLEADRDMHILRVSAPGMQSQEKVVQLDSDTSLHVELLPAQAQPVQGALPTARPSRRPAVAARDREPEVRPVEAPRPAETDFDSRITPEVKPRQIYEEDPY